MFPNSKIPSSIFIPLSRLIIAALSLSSSLSRTSRATGLMLTTSYSGPSVSWYSLSCQNNVRIKDSCHWHHVWDLLPDLKRQNIGRLKWNISLWEWKRWCLTKRQIKKQKNHARDKVTENEIREGRLRPRWSLNNECSEFESKPCGGRTQKWENLLDVG